MPLKCIFISCCSACFELDDKTPYYANEPYNVVLDGKQVYSAKTENVFSLYGLNADAAYTVKLSNGESIEFRTGLQSACVDARLFGAKGDGKTDDTESLQNAINVCPKHGKVKIPAGEYRIRPLILKSFITLELDEGARLTASERESDYPILPAFSGDGEICSAWEGRPRECRQSVLSAYHTEHTYIVGKGCIDGSAQNSTWWTETKSRVEGRPRMLFLNNCEHFVLHGVTVCNSPSWNLHPFRSRNVGIYNVHIIAPADSPNTDGCDPESCDGVKIIGTRFSVGDDAIAIKSGKAEGDDILFPKAVRHTIRNCLMEQAHGAVVLGSEMSGGIDELSVSQCLFIDTDRGLRIKTRRGRGKYGVIDGVKFENILMRGVKTPFVINMFYYCDADGKTEYVWSKKPLVVDERTPRLGSFAFKNIVCEDCQAAAGYFYGLPEQPIAYVELENARITFSDAPIPFVPAMMTGCEACAGQGLFFRNVCKAKLKNVEINGLAGERLMLDKNVLLTEE